MNWYTLFAIAVLLLWLGATDRDRPAAGVILCATLASWIIVDYGTSGIVRPWKLAVPGAVETATIMGLLSGRFTKTATNQAVLVLIAWWLHLLCFADLQLRTNLVYDNYEIYLTAVSVAQLLAFHDTILHQLRRVAGWWRNLGALGVGDVRNPKHVVAISPDPRREGVSEA